MEGPVLIHVTYWKRQHQLVFIVRPFKPIYFPLKLMSAQSFNNLKYLGIFGYCSFPDFTVNGNGVMVFERLFFVIIAAEIHKMSFDYGLTCKQHTFNNCKSYHYQVCKISSRLTYCARNVWKEKHWIYIYCLSMLACLSLSKLKKWKFGTEQSISRTTVALVWAGCTKFSLIS